MILCQISDTHIKAGRDLAYGVVDTAGCSNAASPNPDIAEAARRVSRPATSSTTAGRTSTRCCASCSRR